MPRPVLDSTERKKRRRELIAIAALGVLFLVLTWVMFHLFGIAEQLPFEFSIFFFGLVNFNIILFLLLAFLIFRNVVKEFAEREGGPLGSSLKSKLIAAFVGFSFVPTALMFLVSVFYINNSFDRWFSQKISGILKSSIEVTDSYYLGAKRKRKSSGRTATVRQCQTCETKPTSKQEKDSRATRSQSIHVGAFSVRSGLLPAVPS